VEPRDSFTIDTDCLFTIFYSKKVSFDEILTIFLGSKSFHFRCCLHLRFLHAADDRQGAANEVQRPGEQNVDLRWKVVGFDVMNDFESLVDCRADAEGGFEVFLWAELLPEFLVVDTAVELSVLEDSVEVVYGKQEILGVILTRIQCQLTTLPAVALNRRDIRREADVVEVHGMKTVHDGGRVAISRHVEHQNVDRVRRLFNLLAEPFRADLHAFLGMSAIEEVCHPILLDPLESPLELTPSESIDKLPINEPQNIAIENIWRDFASVSQPLRAQLDGEREVDSVDL
jgi:hypothetical protein